MLRIHVQPRRAPRLPRDHFAMRPQISLAQRVARAIFIGAVAAYAFAQFYAHTH